MGISLSLSFMVLQCLSCCLELCFLFGVLAALCVPLLYRTAVLSLYIQIAAYSFGIGDGSFLFNVPCGVKTGCPLSSVLSIVHKSLR